MFWVRRVVKERNLKVKFFTLQPQLMWPSTFGPLYWALTMQALPEIANLPKYESFWLAFRRFSTALTESLNKFWSTVFLCKTSWVLEKAEAVAFDCCSTAFSRSCSSSSFCSKFIHPFYSSIPGLCLSVCWEALILLCILTSARPTLSWSFSPK
jgi:hypothetical protein